MRIGDDRVVDLEEGFRIGVIPELGDRQSAAYVFVGKLSGKVNAKSLLFRCLRSFHHIWV